MSTHPACCTSCGSWVTSASELSCCDHCHFHRCSSCFARCAYGCDTGMICCYCSADHLSLCGNDCENYLCKSKTHDQICPDCLITQHEADIEEVEDDQESLLEDHREDDEDDEDTQPLESSEPTQPLESPEQTQPQV